MKLKSSNKIYLSKTAEGNISVKKNASKGKNLYYNAEEVLCRPPVEEFFRVKLLNR